MIEAVKRCPDCGHANFFVNEERGEIVCRNCSFVIDDAMLDFGRERMMDEEDATKRSRTGAPFDPRIANNLITDVGSADDLRRLPSSTKRVMERIRKKNRWGSALEQNLSKALSSLELITSHLNLPTRVEKEIARIYRLCAERGITRIRSIEQIVAATVYIASKMQGTPKTLGEVAGVTKVDKNAVANTAKLIMRKLDIKINPTSPIDFVERFASSLDLNAKIQFDAVKLVERIQKMGINSGKSPVSVAATAIYTATLMNKTRITQQRIAAVSGITETTLRNRCKEMIVELGISKKELKRK